MLQVIIMYFGGHLYKSPPFVDLSYNNSYHFNTQMTQFEALYVTRCRYLVGWFDSFGVRPWGTNLLRDSMDRVKFIQ